MTEKEQPKAQIGAELFRNLNDDLTVVNAARVSMNSRSVALKEKDSKLIKYLCKHHHISTLFHNTFIADIWVPFAQAFYLQLLLSRLNTHIVKVQEDKNGVRLLIRGSIWTFARCMFHPEIFEEIKFHCPVTLGHLESLDLVNKMTIKDLKFNGLYSSIAYSMKQINETIRDGVEVCITPQDIARLFTISFGLRAPIFIARQYFKSAYDLAKNEMSRRYVSTEPEFYNLEYRAKPEGSIKQGSKDEIINLPVFMPKGLGIELDDKLWDELLKERYNFLLENNVAPEVARGDLPQKMIVSWMETGSIDSYARVESLRSGGHAQKDIRIIPKDVNDYMMENFEEIWVPVKNSYNTGVQKFVFEPTSYATLGF